MYKVQDLVVGYMGVPKYPGVPMTRHPQYITVRFVIPKFSLELAAHTLWMAFLVHEQLNHDVESACSCT